MGSLGGAQKKGVVWTYKAWIVLLPLCLFLMSAPTNAVENMPVVNLIPLDIEAIVKELEAAKAKNDKIAQRKKEHEEAKHLKEAEEEKNRQEAEAKRVADEAEAERVWDTEEAHKRKVSITCFLVVSG